MLAYDLMRLALSYSQGGADPIPHIGTMFMGEGAPWWWGYAWRTFGNGGGMGVIFTMLCPKKWWGPKLGLAYASMIGLGMLAFLSLFPVAQTQLFKVSWQTLVNSSLGHATYGLMLGTMARGAGRRQERRAAKNRRHATPDEVTRPVSPDTTGSPPRTTSWARPEDTPTELLPVVPAVPPPPGQRPARAARKR